MKKLLNQLAELNKLIKSNRIVLFLLIFLSIQINAQEKKHSKLKKLKYDDTDIPNFTQSIGDKIEFKNSNDNSIITITDEGNDLGSITLSKMLSAPGNIDNKLYNVAGALMFNGSSLDGGASDINGLSDALTLGNSVFLGSGAGANDDGTDNKNYALGLNALGSTTSGFSNAAMGFNSLFFNSTGNYNIGLGQGSLYYNSTGGSNVAVGYHSNHFNQTGSNNTIIGHNAGRGTQTHNKSGNIFIGYQAGYNEVGDNKLYIENSNSATPLIWGDFSTNDVKINGDIHVTGNITTDGFLPADDDWDINGTELLLSNPATFMVGIGTTLTETTTKLHVKGNDGVLFQGTHGNGTTLSLGEGTRFHFYPKKSAIRGGYANTTQWDDSNVGNYSTSFGFNTIASGFYSLAVGQNSMASNTSSVALGANTIASGKWSTALGSGSDAIADYSTAIGDETNAESYASLAIGKNNIGGGNANNWVDSDPLFEIGNGTSSTPSNALTVLKDGKVGIGTNSPSAELEVNGTTKMGVNGVEISEIIKITGTIDNDTQTEINYPTGYTLDNTYILVFDMTWAPTVSDPAWIPVGRLIDGFDGSDEGSYVMYENFIRLDAHDNNYYNGSYRIIVMKIE